jgi:hypothetical protein
MRSVILSARLSRFFPGQTLSCRDKKKSSHVSAEHAQINICCALPSYREYVLSLNSRTLCGRNVKIFVPLEHYVVPVRTCSLATNPWPFFLGRPDNATARVWRYTLIRTTKPSRNAWLIRTAVTELSGRDGPTSPLNWWCFYPIRFSRGHLICYETPYTSSCTIHYDYVYT